MRSDEALMSDVARGDSSAFEQLVSRHQGSVWNVAFRLLGDAHQAEDIAQEAFLRILRAAPRYRPTASFRTYLYRIATRLCRDQRRRSSPSLCPDLDAQLGTAAAPEGLVADDQTRAAVRAALASLPVKQREAVILRYYESLRYDEISQVMGVSPKAIERLLTRGRAGLAKRLSKLVEG